MHPGASAEAIWSYSSSAGGYLDAQLVGIDFF